MNTKPTVLISDDSALVRQLLTTAFESEYEVLLAEDGLAAIDIIKRSSERISAIFLDVEMPKLGGFGVLSWMMTQPGIKDIPAIIITSLNDSDVEIKALDCGAADFLSKPINIDIAKHRLMAVLARRENERLHLSNTLISEQLAHQREINDMFENVNFGVALYEIDGTKATLNYYNSTYCSLLGYSKEEFDLLPERDFWSKVHPSDAPGLNYILSERVKKGREAEFRYRAQLKNKNYRWIQVHLRKLRENGSQTIYIASFMDVDAETKSVQELIFRADHDSLTGIYNRDGFYRLTREMLVKHPKEEFVLLRWNIERFKLYNIIFGREAGDDILKRAAKYIKRNLPETSTLGRIEGDHFVACIPNDEGSIRTAIEKTNKFFKSMELNSAIVADLGIYIITDNKMPIDQMCDCANIALQTIKGDYEIHHAFYDDALRKNMLEELEIRENMHDALDRHQFEVYLQPIYSATNGVPVSAEALVRWRHPEKGMISPGAFIPLFERNGFIAELDSYVWIEVCKILQKRKQLGLPDLPISVNASRRTLFKPRLFEEIQTITSRYNVDPKLFKIEITETAYTDNPDQLLKTVSQLQNAGFPILMDDFGSGYSSFNTLKDIPVDVLKLDMRFMSGFEQGGRVGTIVTSILHMAKWLSLPVIAEGVETVEQAEFLRSIGCDWIQGFLYARPMPYDDFEGYITEERHLISNREALTIDINRDYEPLMGGNRLINRLFEGFTNGIGLFEEANGIIEPVRVSESFYARLGITPLDFTTHSADISTYIADNDKKKFYGLLKEAIKTGSTEETGIFWISDSGDTVPVNTMVCFLGRSDERNLFCLFLA